MSTDARHRLPVSPPKWRTIAAALVAVLAITATVWVRAPPSYLTNDDVSIRQGIEGTLVPGAPPTGFVLTTHAALAWTLAWTQGLVPTIPWWDLVVTGTFMCALAALAAVCWPRLGPGWLARATAATALAVAALPLLSGVQYTISATLAGTAAVALALVELNASPRPRRTVLTAAGVLLIIGLLVRPMAAAMGAVVLGLLLLPSAGVASNIRAIAVRPVIFTIAAAAGLYALVQYSDRLLYLLDDRWNTYYRYHWMVLRLFEWGGDVPAADIARMREAAGWSQNDWTLLTGWFGVDPDVHGAARVATAYDTRSAQFGWDEWLLWAANRATAVELADVRRLAVESAAVLAAILVVAAAYARPRGLVAVALVLTVFGLTCLGIEAVFKELPFRVLAPLQAAGMAAALIATGALRRSPSALPAVMALSLTLTLAVHQYLVMTRELSADGGHAAQVEREVNALEALAPSLVVLHADAFPAEHWWRPFHVPPTLFPAVRLGENNQNPFLQAFLSQTGRQPLLRAVCQDPSILLVSKADRLEPATAYLREHFGTAVTWREVYGASFRAWRCVPSQRPDTTTDDAVNRMSQ